MRDFVFITSAIVAIAVFRSCNAEISCEENIHVNCENRDLYDMLSANGQSMWNEEVLSSHCRDIIADIQCKQDYLKACGYDYFEQHFKILTNSLKNTFIELCNETSELRKNYRIHRPCLSDTSILFERCVLTSVLMSVRDRDKRAADDQDAETVKSLCKFQAIFRRCVTNSVEGKCGNETAQFLQAFMAMPLEDLVASQCPRKE